MVPDPARPAVAAVTPRREGFSFALYRKVAAGPVSGRASQARAVKTILERAHPAPAALIIEGEAGIGTTSLWGRRTGLTPSAYRQQFGSAHVVEHEACPQE